MADLPGKQGKQGKTRPLTDRQARQGRTRTASKQASKELQWLSWRLVCLTWPEATAAPLTHILHQKKKLAPALTFKYCRDKVSGPPLHKGSRCESLVNLINCRKNVLKCVQMCCKRAICYVCEWHRGKEVKELCCPKLLAKREV